MEKEYETQLARKYVRMTFHCSHCLLCDTKEFGLLEERKLTPLRVIRREARKGQR